MSTDALSRPARAAAALAWLGCLTAITLTPAGGPESRIVSICLLCGERGTADALLNIVLFVPLGLLVGRRTGLLVALLLGLSLSATVEAGQLLLAGRYSNVGDLVWNALGAWLGAACARPLHARFAGASPLPAQAVAVGLPIVWLLAASWALRPIDIGPGFSIDDGTSLERPRPIAARKVSAGSRVDRARFGYTLVRARMAREPNGDWNLTAKTIRPPPSRRLAPLVVVYDASDRPVRLLGVDRGDLVLWERTRTPALRLDQANHRLPSGIAGHDVGGVLTVTAGQTADEGLCMGVEQRRTCDLGVSPARTWTLFRSREHASESVKQRVDLAWMATLTLLIGLVGGGARGTLISAGTFAVLVVVLPSSTALVAAGWTDLTGIALGVGGGVLARPIARLIL